MQNRKKEGKKIKKKKERKKLALLIQYIHDLDVLLYQNE